jgi:hypothetical protein
MWIILSWQHNSPAVILKGFEKCFVSSAVDETDDMLWNGSEYGNVRSECKIEALTVKMETVTWIGDGR